ncbi:MAG: hypothetical protein AAF830_13175 [Pseudomonadota bacterium]
MKYVLAALAASFGVANAGVIDFETAPSSFTSLTQDGATLTAENGITIAVVDFGPNGTQSALQNEPRAAYRLTFASLVSGTVSVDMGDLGQDEDVMNLELYSATDVLIDFDMQTLGAGVEAMLTLTATGMDIAYARIFSTGDFPDTYFLDNISFPDARATVPVPAAAPLFAAALAGAGALRRKAKKSA